jgi:KUP system potassium uptake protein
MLEGPGGATAAMSTRFPARRESMMRRFHNRRAQTTSASTFLLALGIVFGDLGTSPLYTLQTIVHVMGDQFTPKAALGSLSLVFWSLIITISVKCCVFVMRSDNDGEGGILALMTMTLAHWSGRGRWLVVPHSSSTARSRLRMNGRFAPEVDLPQRQHFDNTALDD